MDTVRSSRNANRIITVQFVLIVVVLGVLVGGNILFWVRQAEFNGRQIEAVQQQNTAQICAQHDITQAVKAIGRALSLPVQDIVPVDVRGLDCATP